MKQSEMQPQNKCPYRHEIQQHPFQKWPAIEQCSDFFDHSICKLKIPYFAII